jgi:hypothetical protein
MGTDEHITGQEWITPPKRLLEFKRFYFHGSPRVEAAVRTGISWCFETIKYALLAAAIRALALETNSQVLNFLSIVLYGMLLIHIWIVADSFLIVVNHKRIPVWFQRVVTVLVSVSIAIPLYYALITSVALVFASAKTH